MKIYRFDLLFSYWIFAWYVLYQLKWVRTSPKLALILGILTNLYDLVFFLIQNVKPSLLFTFVGMMCIFKVVPLWTVWRVKLDFTGELNRVVVLFLIYVSWLYLNGYTMDKASQMVKTLYTQGKSSATWTPATELILDIQKAIRRQ